MVKKIPISLFHVICIVLIALGLWLRLYKYADFPVGGETRDEYAWTMLGASLLQTGTPISWSFFESYEPIQHIQFGAFTYPIVTPALDHPPIFSLLPGFMHTLVGKSWEEFGSLKVIRLPLVMLGTFNIVLLHFLLLKLTNDRLKHLLALSLYVTVPMWVFGSRLVVAENLLTTWFLLLALSVTNKQINITVANFQSRIKTLLSKILKRKTENFLYIQFWLVLLCAVGVMTKMSGITISLSLFLYGVFSKNKSYTISSVIGGVTGIVCFLIYGAFYDWQIFTSIFFEQSARDIGLATLQNRFFLHPTVVSRILVDGWLIVGLFSVLAVSHKKFSELLFPKIIILAQLLFIVVSVGEQTFHGWYIYGMFPFFAIFLSWWIVEMYRNKDWLSFWIFWIFVLSAVRLLQTHMPLQIDPLFIRIIIGVGGLPFLLNYLLPKVKVAEFISLLLVIFLLVSNVFVIHSFEAQDYWEDDEYFLPKVVVK